MQLLKFTNRSGPRPYFTTKNKWPQKHILYQFPHYFVTHLNTQRVSKATKHMYKSWENLHIGLPLILKFGTSVSLPIKVIHWHTPPTPYRQPSMCWTQFCTFTGTPSPQPLPPGSVPPHTNIPIILA